MACGITITTIKTITSKIIATIPYGCALFFVYVQTSLKALEFDNYKPISQSRPQDCVKMTLKSCYLNLEAHKPLVEGVKAIIDTPACNKNFR